MHNHHHQVIRHSILRLSLNLSQNIFKQLFYCVQLPLTKKEQQNVYLQWFFTFLKLSNVHSGPELYSDGPTTHFSVTNHKLTAAIWNIKGSTIIELYFIPGPGLCPVLIPNLINPFSSALTLYENPDPTHFPHCRVRMAEIPWIKCIQMHISV